VLDQQHAAGIALDVDHTLEPRPPLRLDGVHGHHDARPAEQREHDRHRISTADRVHGCQDTVTSP